MFNAVLHRHAYTPPKVSIEERARYLEKISSTKSGLRAVSCLALEVSKRIKITRPIVDATTRMHKAIYVNDYLSLFLIQLNYAFATTAFDENLVDRLIHLVEQGALAPSTNPKRRVELLAIIAYMEWSKYEANPTQNNINQVSLAERRVLQLTPEDDQDALEWLGRLGRTHRCRYELSGQAEDLHLAINYYQQAVMTASYDYPDLPYWFNNLGISSHMLYNHYRRTEYLEQAVNWLNIAEQLVPDDHPTKPVLFHNLAAAHKQLFEQLSRVDDIERLINFTEDKHPPTEIDERGECGRASQLGLFYLELFSRKGDLEDLKRAIYHTERCLTLAGFDGDSQLVAFIQLGDMYLQLFQRLGCVEDIDKALEFYEKGLQLLSDHDPRRGLTLSALGSGHLARFTLLGNTDNLHAAIRCQQLASDISPEDCLGRSFILNQQGCLYHTLFDRSGDLEHINKSLDCLSQAVAISPDTDPDKSRMIYDLAHAYHSLFRRLERPEDINKAIELQHQALGLIDCKHVQYPFQQNVLGNFYESRFIFSGDFEDLDRSIECQERALESSPEHHAERPRWLNSLGVAWTRLYMRLGVLSDLDKSIVCFEEAISLTPHGHTEKSKRLENLGDSYHLMFDRTGNLEHFNKAVTMWKASVDLTPHGPHKCRRLMKVGGGYIEQFYQSKTYEDLMSGISYQESAVSMVQDDHPEKPFGLYRLAATYLNLGYSSGFVELLHFSLGLFQEALRLTPPGHPNHSKMLHALGCTHLEMFKRTLESIHREIALECFQNASMSPGDPHTSLKASLSWAECSCTPLGAYGRAISLLPQIVWLGTSVARRYELLVSEVRDVVTKAAAAGISFNRWDLAIEWLEEGRNIVWNQMVRLRTPLDHLASVYPGMASQVQKVSQDLENASAPYAASLNLPSDASTLPQAAQEHRRLAVLWEKLLRDVRQLPGFENFLQPKTFSEIAHASRDTTVVIINVDITRCDAIALPKGSQAALPIPLPGLSLQKVRDLQREMKRFLQGNRVRHREGERAIVKDRGIHSNFKSILLALWLDVVQPVLGALGYLVDTTQDKLPRITWCTTGPLAFLPLHAAGNYNDPSARVYNYVISSYTPNLSILVRPHPESSGFQGLLAVGQADASGAASLPGTIMELDWIQETFKAQKFTRLEGSCATAEAVLTAIEKHSWVHLACHASQDHSNPTLSAFRLWGGEMTLAAITKKQLPHAEFAFLSACQTAMGYDQLPDEAVHLAASMLMIGYSSVVATMWSIRDEDAPCVAEHVYSHMLNARTPDCTLAAEALHLAVGRLRNRIGEEQFMRWIPYIHLGC